MRPICEITIDGAPASGLFMSRLMSCVVVDEEGISADRVEIELNDSPAAAIPRRGAIIGVKMGYAGWVANMGDFVAEEIEVTVKPDTMRITGKSVDLGGSAKSQKDRHFDDKTVQDLVSTIAGEAGLASAVHESLAGIQIDYIAQIGESNVAFLERLAQRVGAIFSVKARTVVFVPRGAGVSASGQPIPPQVIGLDASTVGGTAFLISERTRYEHVIAEYMDRGSGNRKEVKVDCHPDGEGEHRMEQPFSSRAEAQRAAEAKSKELQRRALTFRSRIIGNVFLRAGAPVVFEVGRPGLDGKAFIVESATHEFSPAGGYTTSLTGKVQIS